ncbi:MAG: NAD(P)H-dependent oxidoreductase [Hyphomicrobiales bacterium]|nr:NAD(P)H-dependent oxidoreductase [Hyphomicrobiales bacterium]MCP5370297.1 NAD(P)H-dependent oxidoreductase [Hyphomicrobiales bacterium]
MNVLVVYAHQEPRSFCGALRDAAVAGLSAAGHRVVQSDLYAMDFKATATAADFATRANPDFFKYQAEQGAAARAGTFAPDIAAEQAKLSACDLLVLVFPLYWQSVPAILKGWFDRVLAVGYAYGGGRWFDSGPMRGKRALVTMTTGGMADRFRADGLFGDMAWLLHPIHVGTLNFVGFDVLEPFIVWGPASAGAATRAAYLADYRARLAGLFDETPLPFRRPADYPDPVSRDH